MIERKNFLIHDVTSNKVKETQRGVKYKRETDICIKRIAMKKKSIIKPLMSVVATMVALQSSVAEVRLPKLISDGLVLQRDEPIKIWGYADAGESVEVVFKKKKYNATADNNGNWSVMVPEQKAGGPYDIKVGDLEVKDVMIGDVYLCSGQSNMELPIRRVRELFEKEVSEYENRAIRQFIVPKEWDLNNERTELSGGVWKPLTQATVNEYSAICYFMARELYSKTNVAIGLINASWGGTPIEAWVCEDSLKEFPKYINEKRMYEDAGYRKLVEQLSNANYYHWNKTLIETDKGVAGKWQAYDYDDTDWQVVDMFARTPSLKELHPEDEGWKGGYMPNATWGTDGYRTIAGAHWLRKHVTLPQTMEGKAGVIRLGCIVDADSVYVNGVFVGSTGYQYPPRIYPIPEGVLRSGDNVVTVRIVSNGGRPQFIPEKPYKIICGNESVSLEGDWKYRLGVSMPSQPAGGQNFFYKATSLYNAMISPLRNVNFSGVVWYQGESNVSHRDEYATMLGLLMGNWRTLLNDGELPFYIVELADFLHKSDVGGRKAWAEMREEQKRAAEADKHATLVKNSDLGEWNDIHPLDKKSIGVRVAESVLKEAQHTMKRK